MFMNLSEEEKAGRSLRRVGSIGTPHRGSGKSIPGINKTTLDMAKPILPKSIHNFFNTAYEMDNKEMIAFNQKYPNIDGVIYFSITNQQRSPLPRIIPTATKKEMTDGLIAGESSRWGVEIKIDGDHPRGNHINQVYSVAGKDKAATDNGLAIVEFLKQTAHGEAPKDGVFHYQVPENIQYRSPSKYNQMKFMLNCLTK